MATQRPLVLVAGRMKQLAHGDRVPAGVIISPTPPLDIFEGAEWFDETSGIQYTWVGSGWVSPSGVPVPPIVPVMPDGETALSWINGRLVRVDYPDASYLTLIWSGDVLASAQLHRAGAVKTVSLTWLAGVLQSVNTSTV